MLFFKNDFNKPYGNKIYFLKRIISKLYSQDSNLPANIKKIKETHYTTSRVLSCTKIDSVGPMGPELFFSNVQGFQRAGNYRKKKN